MPNIRVSPSEDGVATITLDRPNKKNALSIALREEVIAVVSNTFDRTLQSVASS